MVEYNSENIVLKSKPEHIFNTIGSSFLLYRIYQAIILGLFVFIGWVGATSVDLEQDILWLVLGLVLGLSTIVIHEGIHYMMYLALGFSNVKLQYYKPQKMIFTIVEDQLISRWQYVIILIAPLFSILAMLTLVYCFQYVNTICSLSMTLVHIWLCRGDVQLIAYLYGHQKQITHILVNNSEVLFLDNTQN